MSKPQHEQLGRGAEVDPKQRGLVQRVREWVKDRTEVGQFGLTMKQQRDLFGDERKEKQD